MKTYRVYASGESKDKSRVVLRLHEIDAEGKAGGPSVNVWFNAQLGNKLRTPGTTFTGEMKTDEAKPRLRGLNPEEKAAYLADGQDEVDGKPLDAVLIPVTAGDGTVLTECTGWFTAVTGVKRIPSNDELVAKVLAA